MVWFSEGRTPGLDEALQGRWEPGSVRIEGTIKEITPVQTEQGSGVGLRLSTTVLSHLSGLLRGQSNPEYVVAGDPAKSYRVGDTFQTTIHFDEFTFNGVPAVSPREVVYPFPRIFEAMHEVLDATNWVLGGSLVLIGTDAAGWSSFELVTADFRSAPADSIGLALSEWNRTAYGPVPKRLDSAEAWFEEAAATFNAVSNPLHGEDSMTTTFPEAPSLRRIDAMHSLADAASAGGRLRFVDANFNSLLDDGDRILVRFEPTTGQYRTYLLHLGNCRLYCPVPLKPVLVGPEGPILWREIRGPLVQAGYGGLVDGRPIATEWKIGRVVGASAPLGEYQLNVRGENVFGSVDLVFAPATFGNVTVHFRDADGNGLLSTDDAIVVEGLRNRSTAHLHLIARSRNAVMVGPTWVVGHGPVPIYPQWSFQDPASPGTTSGPSVFVRRATLSPELALGKTLTATVRQGASVIVETASLRAGLVAQWSDGELWFHDHDESGTLSVGDEIQATGPSGTRLQVEIAVLFGHLRDSATLVL